MALPGNIGTKTAQARGLSYQIAKHNYLVSKHTIAWFNGKGRWSLFPRYSKCSNIRVNHMEKLCEKQRHILQAHARRYFKLESFLHPVYVDGGYNWDDLVGKCEAISSGWYANTGNGFFFGPQFTPDTWHGSGGGPVKEMGDANGKPMRAYSIPYIKHVAYRTMQLQGAGAWPHCYPYLYD